MNIILVSGRLAKAKTITLSWPHLALLAGGVIAAVITLAAMLHFAILRFATERDSPT